MSITAQRSPLNPRLLTADPFASDPDLVRFTFDPDDRLASIVIDQLGDPELSLREIAEAHSVTLEALTLWMDRPDIARRIEAITAIALRRARLAAANYLPSLARILADNVNHCVEDQKTPVPPGHLKGLEFLRRSRNSCLDNIRMLVRLAEFDPTRKARRARKKPDNPADSQLPNANASHVRPLAAADPVPQPSRTSALLTDAPVLTPVSPRARPHERRGPALTLVRAAGTCNHASHYASPPSTSH